MKTKRLSVEIGINYRDPEREEAWQKSPASKRNTADMLAEYSAGILIKGYRAYLRGDYVDSRRFAQFMERAKEKQASKIVSEQTAPCEKSVTRLRRMESRYQWALTLRENVSHFILNVAGLSSNCRLRRSATRPPARNQRQAAAASKGHAGRVTA